MTMRILILGLGALVCMTPYALAEEPTGQSSENVMPESSPSTYAADEVVQQTAITDIITFNTPPPEVQVIGAPDEYPVIIDVPPTTHPGPLKPSDFEKSAETDYGEVTVILLGNGTYVGQKTRLDGTKISVVIGADGTETTTATKPDGTKVETIIYPTGMKIKTTNKPDGTKIQSIQDLHDVELYMSIIIKYPDGKIEYIRVIEHDGKIYRYTDTKESIKMNGELLQRPTIYD